MVFGGPGDSTYLGCLNCSKGGRDSVFTGWGTYGSAYVGASVVNPASLFVSEYSEYSACNPFASSPPVIMDEQGKSYGRLTVNQGRSDGPSFDLVRQWIIDACAGAVTVEPV